MKPLKPKEGLRVEHEDIYSSDCEAFVNLRTNKRHALARFHRIACLSLTNKSLQCPSPSILEAVDSEP